MCVCVCRVCVYWQQHKHANMQFFPESLGGSWISALTERVVDPCSHKTTDERDGGSHFEFEGCISSANVSIAGTHRGRRVLDQGSPPPHHMGLSGDPKA